MNEGLLFLSKSLRDAIQNHDFQSGGVISRIASKTQELLDANIAITDGSGKLLAVEPQGFGPEFLGTVKQNDTDCIRNQLNEQLKNVFESKFNFSLGGHYIHDNAAAEVSHAAVMPLIINGERNGTVILVRERSFTDEEIIYFDFLSSALSLIVYFVQKDENKNHDGKIGIVRSAMATLSYSELEAVVFILKELGSPEGRVVASHVADRVGITRSVIVNALRKLESAGVIESRSLGMKGTYIKVLNDKLFDEIRANE